MNSFQIGDKVMYTGKKTFFDDDGEPLSLSDRQGVIFSKIVGNDTGYVVDFGEDPNKDSFVMGANVLAPWRANPNKAKEEKQKGPEVTKRRKRPPVEDE